MVIFWEDKIQVLNGLDFELEEGKITGFLGANGAGKTTFLKILFNFIKYDSGSIKFSKDMGDNFIEIVSKDWLPTRETFFSSTFKRQCLSLIYGKFKQYQFKRLKAKY